MNDIIDSVMASRRLKIFTAFYAMVYIVLSLLINLVNSYVGFLSGGIGGFIFTCVSLIIEAALMYGLIRGIITKNYHFEDGIRSFAEVKYYPVYLLYAAVNIAYESVDSLLGKIAVGEGTLATFGLILSGVMFFVKLAINFYLVKFYFDSVENDGKIGMIDTAKSCIATLAAHPGKVIAAEAFMLITNFVVLMVSTMLANLLPQHSIVGFVLSCLYKIQFGLIIITWPVYYLYYKYAFELKKGGLK